MRPRNKGSALLLVVFVLAHSGALGQRIDISRVTVSNPAERTLVCRALLLDSSNTDLENAVFYLNGTDICNDLTTGEYTEQAGKITFPLTQAREGHYTCGSGNLQSHNELYLVGEYDLV